MVGGDDDPGRDIAAVDVHGRNDALHHGLETLVFGGCGEPSVVRCLRMKSHFSSNRRLPMPSVLSGAIIHRYAFKLILFTHIILELSIITIYDCFAFTLAF